MAALIQCDIDLSFPNILNRITNLNNIHNFMNDMKEYLHNTTNSMQNIIERTNKLKSYEKFNTNLCNHKDTLLKLKERLLSISFKV